MDQLLVHTSTEGDLKNKNRHRLFNKEEIQMPDKFEQIQHQFKYDTFIHSKLIFFFYNHKNLYIKCWFI